MINKLADIMTPYNEPSLRTNPLDYDCKTRYLSYNLYSETTSSIQINVVIFINVIKF